MADDGGGPPEEVGKLPKCDRELLSKAENGTIAELKKILKDGTRLQEIEIRNKNNAAANYAARFALQKELPIALVHCCDVSGDTPLTLACSRDGTSSTNATPASAAWWRSEGNGWRSGILG